MTTSEQLFHNLYPAHLDGELRLAVRLGIAPAGPEDPDFMRFLKMGTVKWAVLADGSLKLLPRKYRGEELPPTVLSHGEPVKAAGMAGVVSLAEPYTVLAIDNECYHYLPSPESIELGLAAFERAGLHVAPAKVRHHQFRAAHQPPEPAALSIKEVFERLGE